MCNLDGQAISVGSGAVVLRLWSGIASEAVRQKLVPQAAIWAVARNVDVPGRGGVEKNMLAKELQRLGIFRASYCRQLLRDGETNAFYRVRGKQAWLNSPARVAYLLDASIGCEVEVPVEALAGGRAARRALLLAVALADRDKPTTRQTIHNFTGVSERTQRRYGGFGLWRSSNNTATIPDVGPPDHMPAFLRSECAAKGVYQSGRKLKKRLPNTYNVGLNTRRRRSKLLAGQLRRLTGGRRPAQRDSGTSRHPPHVFYPSASDYARDKGNKPGTACFEPWPTALNRAYVRTGPGRYEALTGDPEVLLWRM